MAVSCRGSVGEETKRTHFLLRGLKVQVTCQGHLRIASVESVSVALLPELLEAYRKRYPGISFTVTVAGSALVSMFQSS